MTQDLNGDLTQAVHADTATMEWQASPSPSVWRKRLDRRGPAEAGRVTSVVRYDPDSRFSAHPHPDGEEILVLDGVFSDQTGDYPAGSYLLNPEGFEHAPFSKPGCLLFVKLRQYPGLDRRHVLLKTDAMPWRETGETGVAEKVLYDESSQPERVVLHRLDAGATSHLRGAGGHELFVTSGSLIANGRKLETGGWLRSPDGRAVALESGSGATFYLKTGHLTDAD
jgi:anti-sigma factor ChrR (cupin superfamily)